MSLRMIVTICYCHLVERVCQTNGKCAAAAAEIAEPVSVRYAWANDPVANL